MVSIKWKKTESLKFHSDCTAEGEPTLFPNGSLTKKMLCVMRHVVVESRYLCATNSCLHTPEEKTNQGHLRTACQLLFLLAILCSMCVVEAHISTTTSSWGSQGISNYILAARICMVTTAKWSYFIQQRLYLSLEKAIAPGSINAATQAI